MPTHDMTRNSQHRGDPRSNASLTRGLGDRATRNLHGQVVQMLGIRIVSGELSPGEILPREATLAQQMDVSRTSLREAMKVLSAKGLVKSRTKIGTRVCEQNNWNQLDPDVLAWRCQCMPTADFVQKLVEMREIIEPAAAAAAARRRLDHHLRQLQNALKAMEQASDRNAWTEADVDFHEAILNATGNDLLASLFAVIETALSSYFTLSAHSASDFKYSLPHHEKVYQAIRKQQPEAARRAMQRIISDSRTNMENVD